MNVELLQQSKRFFFILHSTFFILFFTLHSSFFIPTARAAEEPLPPLNTFCFTETECRGEPYRGQLSSEQSECLRQDRRYVEAGYKYHCYAPQKPYTLQTPLLGRTVGSLEEYISRVFQWLVGIVGVVAGIMIIWAGVKWLTAGGIPDRISDAKHKIADALVGLILVLSSYFILQTINPALVRLRLPPIKQVRQELTGKEDCVNRSEFVCGQMYQCDAPAYISNPPCTGGIKPGECTGQFCPSRTGGCYTLLADRITLAALQVPTSVRAPQGAEPVTRLRRLAQDEQRLCINPDTCRSCAPDLPWETCVSSACNCILTVGQSGENTGRVICASSARPGQSCSSHSQCQSGRCNFGKEPDACTPLEGEDDDQPCDEDADCASRICNTLAELTLQGQVFDGVCQSAGSLGRGDDCDRGALCESGLACVNDTPLAGGVVPRGGPGSGPQSNAEILGVNAECEPL